MKIHPAGLIGFGIGLMIGAIAMTLTVPSEMSAAEIERQARDMGMIYPVERTVIEALSEED